MKLPTDMIPDTKGILPAAYIGVDGNRYRVRVPVKRITIEPVDTPAAQSKERSFESWHAASWFLAMRAKETDRSRAEHFKFHIIWANGFEYNGSYILRAGETWPVIENQARGFLEFLANEDPPAVSAVTREDAALMLKALDMGQHQPDPAPEYWPVVHDYRANAPEPGAPRLENDLYAAHA
jgi:hypothetical protein